MRKQREGESRTRGMAKNRGTDGQRKRNDKEIEERKKDTKNEKVGSGGEARERKARKEERVRE